MAQPQTRANQLTDQVNEMMHRDDVPSEIEVARLTRDAKSLIQVEPERAYDLLGMIAALVFDVNESVANHKRAISIDPDSDMLNLNFCVSLDHLGRTSQAIYYAERALECETDQETKNYILGLLYELYFKAGYVKRAKDFREKVPVDDDSRIAVDNLFEEICTVYDFMRRHAISDTDLSRYIEILEKFAAEKSVPCIVSLPFASETDEAALICVSQRVMGDADLALDLNLALADYLATQEALPDHVTDFVACSFVASQM